MLCLPRPHNITNRVCGIWQEGRLAFEVKYLPELEVNKAKLIHLECYQLGKRQQLVAKIILIRGHSLTS